MQILHFFIEILFEDDTRESVLAAPKYCKSVPDKIFILDLYSERKCLLDQKQKSSLLIQAP